MIARPARATKVVAVVTSMPILRVQRRVHDELDVGRDGDLVRDLNAHEGLDCELVVQAGRERALVWPAPVEAQAEHVGAWSGEVAHSRAQGRLE